MSYRRTGQLTKIRRIGVEEVSVEWEIYDLLSLRRALYGCPGFRFGDLRWRLRLWPNWTDERSSRASGWVKLGIRRFDGGPPKTFHISVGIKGYTGVDVKREEERKFLGYDSYDWDKFCSRSELKEHIEIPYGELTITCVIKIPVAARAMEELQKSYQWLLDSKEDCDVIIKVNGKEFRAHTLILRARSPVFQAMFTHDMVEKQRGTVTIEDCDPETFPDFLEHIYTGNIEMISAKNVFGLYGTSDKYDLSILKKECAQFVKRNLTVDCFCKAITLAVRHSEKELIELATDFFCSNSVNIVKTAEWQVFMKENVALGNELLNRLALIKT